MVITLQRFGGVAGILRPPSVLDTGRCTPARCAELESLAHQAGFFELPAEILPDSATPDSFQYELSVKDGAKAHSVTTTESAAPETLRALLHAVREALREGSAM